MRRYERMAKKRKRLKITIFLNIDLEGSDHAAHISNIEEEG
jgi:hypothetical protein